MPFYLIKIIVLANRCHIKRIKLSVALKKQCIKQILLAIDAIYADKNTLKFACYLGRLTKSKVSGVFLENFPKGETPVLKQMQGMAYPDCGYNYQIKK